MKILECYLLILNEQIPPVSPGDAEEGIETEDKELEEAPLTSIQVGQMLAKKAAAERAADAIIASRGIAKGTPAAMNILKSMMHTMGVS